VEIKRNEIEKEHKRKRNVYSIREKNKKKNIEAFNSIKIGYK